MLSLSRPTSAHIAISVPFLCSKNEKLLGQDRAMDRHIHTGGPSEVAISQSGQYVIKLIKARSWHESFKAFWKHSRLNKEITGNQLLNQAGLKVAKIEEVAFHPFPLIKRKFLGYYIMQNLEQDGFLCAETTLKHNHLTETALRQAAKSILDDLSKMRDLHILNTDLNLGNIMINAHGEIAWIDTGVSRFKRHCYKYQQKYNRAITRFLQQGELKIFGQGTLEQIEALKF